MTEGYKVSIKDSMTKMITVLETGTELLRKRLLGTQLGLSTGIVKLDEILGGELGFGQNVVIAGRSGTGKTTMANILSYNLIDFNKEAKIAVLYWNFEMTNTRQAFRFFSNRLQVTVSELLSGKISLESLESLSASFKDYPIMFESVARTSNEIYSFVHAFKKQYPDYEIINILDHTRLIRPEKGQDERTMIDVAMAMFNSLKKELNCINVILSQLNREFEKENVKGGGPFIVPTATNIFGSDSVYQLADTVLMLYRPDSYAVFRGTDMMFGDISIPVDGKLFINAVKNRDGETETTIMLKQDLKYNRVSEIKL